MERRVDYVRPDNPYAAPEHRGKWVGSEWTSKGADPGKLLRVTPEGKWPVFDSRLKARAWQERLTEPQTRLLLRVAAQGEVRLNGRARKTVKALQDAGFVEVEHDLRLAAIGKATELYTLRLREDS